MVAVKILKLCRAANNFKLVNEYLMLLSKRSGQLKQVISKTVEEGTSYIDGLNRADQIELIETLRAITEGKLFVEVERARLTKRLADIYESDGNLHKASKTLQEVQVETVGGMAMHERIQLLLEQIRLCLAEGDYVRTQIISNKVQQKHLQKEEHKDLRIRFYEQQIELHKYKRDP
ncbi:Psmd12, partial [Symbiodinium sp. KB8]